MPDAIIFDIDGTLWDSTENVAVSWNRAIEKQASRSVHITSAKLKQVFGKSLDDLCNELFASLPPEERLELGQACMEYENIYLREHPGTLYPGVYETLRELSQKLPLYIVSNCQSGYVEICIETTGLEPFISGHLCFGDTRTDKDKTIRTLMERYGIQDAVYVGDTAGDAQSCQKAGVPFIWASYGFGQVPDAERTIRSISELPSLLGL